MRLFISLWLALSSLTIFAEPEIQDTEFNSTLIFHPLDFGHQGDLNYPAQTIAFGDTAVDAVGIELPPYFEDVEIDFYSINSHEGLFLPVVLLLNDQFDLINIYETPTHAGNLPFGAEGLYFNIEVTKDARYMVFYAHEEWNGRQYRFSRRYSSPGYMLEDTYAPGISSVQMDRFTLNNQPHLNISLPEYNDVQPNYLHSGWEFGFGVDFGGEKVANNGDNGPYNVGAGGIIWGGYVFNPGDNLEARTRVGVLYQGGEGHGRGLVLQTDIGYHFPTIAAGIGLQTDIGHSIKGDDGETTEFDTAINPRLFLAYKAGRQIRYEASFKKATYKSKGKKYDGESFGIFLVLYF